MYHPPRFFFKLLHIQKILDIRMPPMWHLDLCQNKSQGISNILYGTENKSWEYHSTLIK